MPRDLASDPGKTVFAYKGIISPPKDWTRWADLVRALVTHLVDRYGLDEVRDNWAFEVWNEANLSVFWSGTPADYWRLYEVTARAVKTSTTACGSAGRRRPRSGGSTSSCSSTPRSTSCPRTSTAARRSTCAV